MRSILLMPILVLVCGCAAARADRLPVCDGLTQRPANPYGSVLVPSAADTPPPTPPDTAEPSGGCL